MKLADMPSCPGGGGSRGSVELLRFGKILRVLIRHVANYSVKVRILPLQLQAKA
jgi:hypothetical protein